MPKCFMTGLEIRLEEALILDRREAYRALKELRGKINALERLISELGQVERVELPDKRTGKTFTRIDSRLVCINVAQALSVIWPEKRLFIRWTEWKAQREETKQNLKHSAQNDEEGRKIPPEEARHGPDV
jgi:hypothetical protein